MALFGQGALAMWWDTAPAVRPDFEDWHSHQHFPERLGIPGFRRGTRWHSEAGDDGVFVLYEVDDHAVLSSSAYVARLDAPTPWSTRLMPHLRDMVRSQCRVVASRGRGVARHALTLRLSPADGGATGLQQSLRALVDRLPERPGLTGAHLLVHETPDLAPTTEQKIRQGADRVAPWILVVCGYHLPALAALPDAELSDARLQAAGARPGVQTGLYAMSDSATPADVL